VFYAAFRPRASWTGFLQGKLSPDYSLIGKSYYEKRFIARGRIAGTNGELSDEAVIEAPVRQPARSAGAPPSGAERAAKGQGGGAFGRGVLNLALGFGSFIQKDLGGVFLPRCCYLRAARIFSTLRGRKIKIRPGLLPITFDVDGGNRGYSGLR
jgi:hypothetical protein